MIVPIVLGMVVGLGAVLAALTAGAYLIAWREEPRPPAPIPAGEDGTIRKMSVAELAERIVLTERIRPPAQGTGWGVYVYQGPEDTDRHPGALPPMLFFRDDSREVAEKACAAIRQLTVMSMRAVNEVRDGERKLVLRVLTRRAGTRWQLAADLIAKDLDAAWGPGAARKLLS